MQKPGFSGLAFYLYLTQRTFSKLKWIFKNSLCYLQLLNVNTPVSVESERAFSAVGVFLHENMLSPQRSHDQHFMFSPLILPGRAGTALINGTF